MKLTPFSLFQVADTKQEMNFVHKIPKKVCILLLEYF